MICWQHCAATFVGIREPVGTFHVIPVVCLNTSPLSLKAVKTNRCLRQNVAFACKSHWSMGQLFIEFFCRLKNLTGAGSYEWDILFGPQGAYSTKWKSIVSQHNLFPWAPILSKMLYRRWVKWMWNLSFRSSQSNRREEVKSKESWKWQVALVRYEVHQGLKGEQQYDQKWSEQSLCYFNKQ